MSTKQNTLNMTLRCIYPIVIYLLIQEVMFMFIMPAALSYVSSHSSMTLSSDMMTQKYMVSFTAIAALICIPILYPMYKKDRLAGQVLISDTRIKPINYVKVILSGVFLCIGLSFLVNFFLFSSHVDSFDILNQTLFSGSVLIQFIGIGLITPISEELIFRGLVQNRIYTLIRHKKITVLITAILFGLFHGNIVQSISAFVSALLICVTYEKYRSLRMAILMHIAFNLTGIIMEAAGIYIAARGLLMLIGLPCTLLSITLIFYRDFVEKSR